MTDPRPHWTGCWDAHVDCAAREIERLQGQVERMHVSLMEETRKKAEAANADLRAEVVKLTTLLAIDAIAYSNVNAEVERLRAENERLRTEYGEALDRAEGSAIARDRALVEVVRLRARAAAAIERIGWLSEELEESRRGSCGGQSVGPRGPLTFVPPSARREIERYLRETLAAITGGA